jgi:hypothetical protein
VDQKKSYIARDIPSDVAKAPTYWDQNNRNTWELKIIAKSNSTDEHAERRLILRSVEIGDSIVTVD